MKLPEQRPVEEGGGAPVARSEESGGGDSKHAGDFRQIGERARLDSGFFRIATGTFVGPDGFTFERELVRHLGAVCVVPLEQDGKHVVCVRQYRGAVDAHLLELPAGKLDVPGEPTEACARRELAEEVGLAAGELVELGRFYNSPGFSDEHTTCYLARDLRPVERAAQGIEERHMTIERLELDRFADLVRSGELLDAKTIIGCAVTLRYLAEERANVTGP